MYLNQESSAFLFTILRITLQASSLFLISNIASRTYNLIYLERINGGFLTQVNYLFFTKFPSKYKQYHGRLYVALALAITVAVNYVPTLLSRTYPVKSIHFISNQTVIDLSDSFMKPSEVKPGQTSVENILFIKNIDVNGSMFYQYTVEAPSPIPCKALSHNQSKSLTCPGTLDSEVEVVKFFRFDDRPIFGFIANDSTKLNGTTPEGEKFEYFNLTNNYRDSYNYVNVYYRIGYSGNELDYYQPNGPSSLDGCVMRSLNINKRCVRDSLGYHNNYGDNTLLISRKMLVELLSSNNTLLGQEQPPFDCSSFSTPNFRVMCNQLSIINTPNYSRMFTIQRRTNNTEGNFHWDIFTKIAQIGVNETYFWQFEAFSLDVEYSVYNTTMTPSDWAHFEVGSLMDSVRNQEVFEATMVLTQQFIDWKYNTMWNKNTRWTEWGYSKEDKENLTNFLFAGTLLNKGKIVMLQPVLLADISEVVIGILFGISFLMVFLGLIISRGIPSIVMNPLSEVIYGVMTSTVDRKFFQKHYVANLTLEQEAVEDIIEEDENMSATSSMSILPVSQWKQRRYILQIDIDRKDDSTIELMERIKTTSL